ncbi:hypothetical protein ACXHXM_01975
MFKLVKNLTCWWPVKVMEPDPDAPGKMIEYEFEIEFEIIDRDEAKSFDELREGVLATAEKDQSAANMKKVEKELDSINQASFRRVIKNWRGIVDEDRKPITFTEEAFAAAMKHDRIRVAINRAYQEAISQDKARLGN